MAYFITDVYTCCSCNQRVEIKSDLIPMRNFFCLKNKFYSLEEALKKLCPEMKVKNCKVLKICVHCKNSLIEIFKKHRIDTAESTQQKLPDNMKFDVFDKMGDKEILQLSGDTNSKIINFMSDENLYLRLTSKDWAEACRHLQFWAKIINEKQREHVD